MSCRQILLAVVTFLIFAAMACEFETPVATERGELTKSSRALSKMILAHVTGGGQVEGATFSVEALSSALQNTITGSCSIVDSKEGLEAQCLDIQFLVDSDLLRGNSAWMEGCASVGGVVTPYRIDLLDLREPGDGADQFSFSSALYSVKGVVTNGNITIHKSAEDGEPPKGYLVQC